MQKRGISTLIATVLIIGIGVLIATALFVWAMGFSADIQEGATEKNKETMDCAKTKLNLRYGCLESDNIKLMLENQGQIALEGLNIRVIGNSGGYREVLQQKLEIAGLTQLNVERQDVGKLKVIEILPVLKNDVTCSKGEQIEAIGLC